MASHRYIFQSALAILAVCTVALGSQSQKQTSKQEFDPAKHGGIRVGPPAPSQKPLPTLSAQEIFKRVSPSVMVVESLDAKGKVAAFGSGVGIAPGAAARRFRLA